jgi:hypothetical protein
MPMRHCFYQVNTNIPSLTKGGIFVARDITGFLTQAAIPRIL